MTSAFYDASDFDYEDYWRGRDYENLSEAICLKEFFKRIPNKSDKILVEVGAGFGRLTCLYHTLFKKSILVEPAGKLRKLAINRLKNYKNVKFLGGEAEKIPLGNDFCDIVLVVRVAHHLVYLDKAVKEIKRILKPGGFLALEFANKIHFRAVLRGLISLNPSILNHESIDRRSKEVKTRGAIPFMNHHPARVLKVLAKEGFKIISKRSVSNFRFPVLKKILPLGWLLKIEGFLQPELAKISFGPSIFLLCQKA